MLEQALCCFYSIRNYSTGGFLRLDSGFSSNSFRTNMAGACSAPFSEQREKYGVARGVVLRVVPNPCCWL
jgi:hypothetical protein